MNLEYHINKSSQQAGLIQPAAMVCVAPLTQRMSPRKFKYASPRIDELESENRGSEAGGDRTAGEWRQLSCV